jgi:hypothetical protein
VSDASSGVHVETPDQPERSYDGILITAACVFIGAMIAIYVAAVSGAVDPIDPATMVAFP